MEVRVLSCAPLFLKAQTGPAPGEQYPHKSEGKPCRAVRHQSASVRIYAGQIRGKTCYKIAFYLDVRRHRRLVGDLEKTGREAKLAADVSDFPLRRLSCTLKPILGLAEKSISCQ